MKTEFRCLTVEEIPAGYRLVVERTDWLNQKGIRQWDEPLPEAIFRQRQADGSLYGYWVEDELVAVVSLLGRSVSDWGDRLQGSYLYLATLVSAVRYVGQGYGSGCVKAACEYAGKMGCGTVYLDCVDTLGALPAFYRKLGFEQIGEKIWQGERRVVLMVKDLQAGG